MKLMLNCKQASQMISQSLEVPLSMVRSDDVEIPSFYL